MAPSYTPHLGRILYPLLHTLMEPMRSRFKSEEAPETFLCHSVSKTRTATSFKQLFASWRLQDASAEQSLNSSPSLQLASRAEQAGSTRALAPHCRLQVDGGNCSKKCFSTSLPPPVLEILKYISAHSLLYSSWPVHQIWQILLHTPYLKETTWSFTTPFHNGIFHGQFHWRLIQMCTNRHVYFELRLKSTGRVLSFSNCEPSPSTFLPIFQT